MTKTQALIFLLAVTASCAISITVCAYLVIHFGAIILVAALTFGFATAVATERS